MITVSAIIPTYNRSLWVQEAIDSVLAQRDVDVECIVIDDGSTDGTENVVKQKYGERIRYIYQENQGESAARNKGAVEAKGRYLAFLDSDDLWLPEKLKLQTNFLEENPEYAAVYCQTISMDERGRRLIRKPGGQHFTNAYFTLANLVENGLPLSGSTIMVRADIFHKIQGFDPGIRYGEDLDICLMLLRAGHKVGIVPKPLVRVRYHSQSQSLGMTEKRLLAVLQDHKKIYEKAVSYSGPGYAEVEKAVSHAIGRAYFRVYCYYLYVKDEQQAEAFREKVIDTAPDLLASRREYERQIWVMLPMLFNEFTHSEQILEFVDKIIIERNQHCEPNLQQDTNLIIRASVFCAIHGGRSDQRPAWRIIREQLIARKRLLFSASFWRQVIKLSIAGVKKVVWAG